VILNPTPHAVPVPTKIGIFRANIFARNREIVGIENESE
jgi:hypothetical protein